jgi:hypothetical protein
MADEQSRREADRLYWDTDSSVAEIADRLQVSRRALYDLIQPRPASAVCPECGGDLVFRNRSAAARREAVCSRCEHQVTLQAPDVERDDAGRADDASHAPEAPAPWGHSREDGHGALIGAGLLAGMALGAATAFLLRRR